ncbi:MAG: sulfotransferase, partial [Luteimonas sp.]|nr:sulfotransferase [Luteimonas sp.]
HVPIVTTPAVRFHCGDAEINMGAGECWIFDTWRRHGVVNTGDVDRIHLVMDTVGGERFWEHVNAGARPAGVPGLPAQAWTPRFVGFDANAAAPVLDFESTNVPVVMTPWELREHVSFLLREAMPDPRLAPIQRTLSTFIRSWQAAWACHGEDHAGWPRYRALLQSLHAELIGLGIAQIGLRNETGLLHALTACVFDVALADGASGQDEARRDHHGESDPAHAATPATAAAHGDTVAAAAFDRPVFIVSPPRSGSTLLFETLATAPGVYTIGDESHGLIEGIAELDPARRGFDSNRLLAVDAQADVATRLRQRFWSELRDRDRRAPAGSGAVRMLEKTPKNALRIPLLREVFPDARFIYLHRDPRQVLGSMLDGWESGDFRTYSGLPGWQAPAWSFLLVPGWRELSGKALEDIVAAQWERTTRILLDDLDALPDGHWTSVDYDRLVAHPQDEIARICAWAGLGWDRSLGATLPLSRYTLTPPSADKWRRHAARIEPRLAAMQSTVERARTSGG